MSDQKLMTRDQILSDAVVVTSDNPAVVSKAFKAAGNKVVSSDADNDADDSAQDEPDDAKSDAATAKSGDDSDSSVDSGDDDADADDADAEIDPDEDEPGDEKDDESDSVDTTDKKPKHGSRGFNRRIAGLNRKIAERDQQIAERDKRWLEYTSKQAEKAAPVETAKLETATEKVEAFSVKPAPKQDDTDAKGKPLYDTYGEFVEATSAWAAQAVKDAETSAEKRTAKMVEDAITKLKADFEAKETQATVQAEVKAITNAYEVRKAAYAAKVPNAFKKYITDNPNRPDLGPGLSTLIITHDKGPEVMLHLCKHPKEAARIKALAPDDQKVEFGIIVASFKSNGSKAKSDDNVGTRGSAGTKPKSVRPNEPIPRGAQAGGKGSGGPMTYRKAENMSGDDYIAARRAGTIR